MAREIPSIFAMTVAVMPFCRSWRALAASASSTLRGRPPLRPNLKNPHPTRAGHEVMADLNALIEAIGFDRYDRLMHEINRRTFAVLAERLRESS